LASIKIFFSQNDLPKKHLLGEILFIFLNFTFLLLKLSCLKKQGKKKNQGSAFGGKVETKLQKSLLPEKPPMVWKLI